MPEGYLVQVLGLALERALDQRMLDTGDGFLNRLGLSASDARAAARDVLQDLGTQGLQVMRGTGA